MYIAVSIKETMESWFETRWKVDHQLEARAMENLGENEILAQFCQLFARFALFMAKNDDV